MRPIPIFLIIALVATPLTLCVTSQAQAQDPLELEAANPNNFGAGDWGLAVTPYAWLAANATDVAGATLRQSFNDLASITNVGFQSRLLARYRWVVFAADWTFAKQESDTGFGRTSLDMQLTQHILDMKLGGKVYDSRTAARDGGIGIWVAAGARYWDSDVDFTITTESLVPGNDPVVVEENTGMAYWDPVLGLNMHWPITPKVGFGMRLTGGGFNIGNASKYMWDAEFTALFRLTRRMLLSAGYRQFKYDRTDDGVHQVVTVTGPAIGLSIGIF
ncbi:hypothetical protein DRQ32_04890 [bacterium]|nr:MAG: hypothetical protein DRQ32_04890 [bacterium]